MVNPQRHGHGATSRHTLESARGVKYPSGGGLLRSDEPASAGGLVRGGLLAVDPLTRVSGVPQVAPVAPRKMRSVAASGVACVSPQDSAPPSAPLSMPGAEQYATEPVAAKQQSRRDGGDWHRRSALGVSANSVRGGRSLSCARAVAASAGFRVWNVLGATRGRCRTVCVNRGSVAGGDDGRVASAGRCSDFAGAGFFSSSRRHHSRQAPSRWWWSIGCICHSWRSLPSPWLRVHRWLGRGAFSLLRPPRLRWAC